MPSIVFDNFNGGQPEDNWNANKNFFTEAVHVDNFSMPGRLRPYRSWDEVTGGNEIKNLILASDGSMYGLGEQSGGEARIFEMATFSSNWTQPSNNDASSGTVSFQMFFEHQGYLYFWTNLRTIGRFKLDGTSFTTSWFTVPTSVTNSTGGTIPLPAFAESVGYRFSLNDQAYFAYGNALFGINNSTDTPVLLLLLPQEFKITTISFWQDYLAVGCSHLEKYGDSKVFFWDTLSADPSFVEEIPEGRLEILENVGGELAAIMEFGSSGSIQASSIIASTYNGGEFIQRRRLTISDDTELITIIEPTAVVKNNQLYFGAKIGTDVFIYRFGFNSNLYCLTKDKYVANNNDNASQIFAMAVNGDTFFTCLTYSGATETYRTNTDKDYTMTTKPNYQTIYIPAGESGEKGKLNFVGVQTLPTAGEGAFTPATQTIVVSYKADSETSYTTLGTHDAAEQDYTKLTESGTDNEFPDNWKSITLRLEITGLTQLHKLEVNFDNVPSDVG